MSRERPMLFNANMVRAILDGRKTQTRRVVKPQPGNDNRIPWPGRKNIVINVRDNRVPQLCPYGKPGDRIWVRETWQGYRQTSYEYDEWEPMESPKDRHEEHFSPVYRADGKSYPDKWFPAIHMPREFSRITLEVAGVRVERLQDISEEDAKAEGADPLDMAHNPSLSNAHRIDFGGIQSHKAGFRKLWESINRPGSWDANPWVWVIEFRRLP